MDDDAAEHQHEQELLQQDPAFLLWLEKLDAEREHEQEPIQVSNLNDLDFDNLVPSESKYLAKGDVGTKGRVLTIKGFRQEMVKGDDGEEQKVVVHFVEQDVKPMILNRTNSQLIGVVTGAKNAGEARGKKILVVNDPTISFGGRVTGGLRIRQADAIDDISF